MRNNSSSGSGKSNGKGGFKKDFKGGAGKSGGFKRKDDGDRPKRSFSRDDEGSDRPRRSFSRDDKPFDKPKRSFGKDDRFKKDGDNERPKRSFSRDDKPFDKPKRSFGKDDRFKKDGDSERPKRSFSRDDKPFDKPKRSFGKDDRFKRDGDSERPKRSFSRDDKSFDKSKRSFGKDDRFKRDGDSERPKRSFNKEDKFSKDEKPFKKDFKGGDKPKRFGKDDKPKKDFDKKDKPESSKRFSERNVFKEDKVERPVEDYEKNFVTPKEFEKSLEDKKVVIKGRRDDNFDKPFPLGSKKVSGPFRKKEEEEKAGNTVKPLTKRKRKDDEEGDDAPKEMTLNKYIAHSGECSRREAAELVKQGKVKVNGELVMEPGYRVQEFDQVTIAGKKLTPTKGRVYILLNKPKGFITTTDDPEGRETVMDLVANAGIDRLFPVGRLDRNTTGLLLLTNDGDLAQKLSHPSYETKKVYQASLDKPLTKADFEKIANGLTLDDGEVFVDAISYLDEKNEIGLEIHSGRNRIVRRIFESLGYEVEKLDRVMYAGLTKKNLPRGNWRFLTEREVVLLKHFKS